MHSNVQDHKMLTHVLTTEDAQIIVDDLYNSKFKAKPIKAKGSHVHKTAMKNNELAILSKD